MPVHKNKTEIRITETPGMLAFGYEVRIIDFEAKSFATLIEMRTVVGDESESVPAVMTLSREEIQAWMDQLWKLGIRPSNGSGDANAIEALRGHLSDMRALVFVDKVEPTK